MVGSLQNTVASVILANFNLVVVKQIVKQPIIYSLIPIVSNAHPD